MYMDEKMDTGDIILKKEVKIGEDETTGELWERLALLGGEMLVETVKEIETGAAPRIKQSGEVSMAPMLTKDMAKIRWETQKTQEIKNLVRGLNPIMGAFAFYKGKKIKLWKVDCVNDEELEKIVDIKSEDMKNMSSGTIVYADCKKGLYIKTVDGILQVLEIQAENAKRMEILEFMRGNLLKSGEIFE